MIFLGIGSNLSSPYGDRFFNINLSMSYLDSYGIKIIKNSSFYETPSYPNKNDPKFLNIVTEVDTKLPPEDLASVLIYIEEKLGRKRQKKNDPRTCDIDILDFNGKVHGFKYKNLDFIVPHKKLIYRNFVLYPLKEICTNWIHPETKQNIDTLIKNLPEEDRKSILKLENN